MGAMGKSLKEVGAFFPSATASEKLKIDISSWGVTYSEFNGHVHIFLDPAKKPDQKKPRKKPNHVGPRPARQFDRKGRAKF